MRTMYDATNVANLPAGGDLYAGYVGGSWPTFSSGELASWAARHAPRARLVSIAVASYFDAHVLDVERGDATPDRAPGWAARQRARGNPYPAVYTYLDSWPAVRRAFDVAAVPEPLYWIAHYGAPAMLPGGMVALQHTNDVSPGYDISVVADYWPGIDPPPQEDDMTPEERAMLADVHNWLDQLVNGVPGFGVEPVGIASTFTHRTVDNLARKLGAVVAGPDNPLGQ